MKLANVDLDVEGMGDPKALVAAVEGADGPLYALRNEFDGIRYQLTFEVNGSGVPENAEVIFRALLDAIEATSGDAREIWNRATRRVFDIGYWSSTKKHSMKDNISTTTLRRVVALEGEIAITIYAPDPDDEAQGA